MADRIEPFTITVPAGTLQSAHAEFPLNFADGRVDRLEIRVPPGPSGLVGFRVAHSGQSVIPYSGSEWIVADNEYLDWDTDNYPVGNAWEVWAYNEDVYPHALYFRFHITEVVALAPITQAPISIQALGEAEDTGNE